VTDGIASGLWPRCDHGISDLNTKMDLNMIRLLSSIVLLFALVAPSFGAAQFQQGFFSVGDSNVSVNEPGNAFEFSLPNSVGAGNLLVLKITYPDGNTVSTISDTVNGSWSTTAAVTTRGGTGNNDTSVFLFPNSGSGVLTITINFNSTVQPAIFTLMEWSGIATSSPNNGTTSNPTVTGPTLSCGSFTPTNNNANGGNLILAFFDFANGASASGNPTSWSAGTSFTLMDADIGWGTNHGGLPKASEYFVQTTSAAINPGMTSTGDSVDRFNCVAIALALASAGTQGNGLRVNKFIEQFNISQNTTTWKLQFPTTGNLRVWASTADIGVTSIVDSEGNIWTNASPTSGVPPVWYWPGASANSNLTLTVTLSAAVNAQVHAALYDISGAAASPLGATSYVGATNVSGLTSIGNQPDITPQSSNSLIIALIGDGQGPVTAVTSPTGALSNILDYTGNSDGSNYSSGDGWALLHNTSTSSQNWTWTITSQPSNSVSSFAVEFRSAPGTISHDFNGDGKSDIVWRDTSGDVAIWLMNGAQVLQAGGVGTAPAAVWSIVGQRDFNGNGMADLLWRDTSGDVAIWFMNGTQVTQSAGVGNVPTVWSVVGTGDFNGDGIGDILWQDTSGDVAIWLMNGAQITQVAGVGNAPPSVWKIVGTGDFNGDGKRDILWQDSSGDVAIWFMNGTQVAQAAGVGNAPPSVWKIVGTGDFNGDGKSDILWQDTSGNVAIWLMDGSQITQSTGVGSAPLSVWSIVETGDFNGDGNSDILWQDKSGDIAIWFMNGAQVAQAVGVGNIPSTVWSIQNANAD
jgi:hypothetical protein